MAFKVVNNSEGFIGRKLYKGIAPIKIIAVCPTKEKITELTGREPQYDVNYIQDVTYGDSTVKCVNVTFFVNTISDDIKNCRLTFKVYKQPVVSKDGKYKVIDTFGRTAWATAEELHAHSIPKYKDGNCARICADYRPLFKGEENLEMFIRAWFNIYDPETYDPETKKWVMRSGEALEKARGLLENPSALFNGDFSEISTCVDLGKNNAVKAMFGVRTGQDGKQYQDIFTDLFIRNVVSEANTIKKFTMALGEAKSLGRHPSSEYATLALNEFKVTPTDFSTNSTEVNNFDPFGDNDKSTEIDEDDLPFGDDDDDPLSQFC